MWDLESRREVLSFQDGEHRILCAVFRADGKLLTGDEQGVVALWDLATRQPVLQVRGHRDSVVSLALTPDGRRALSGSSDGAVGVWERRRVASGR